MHKALFLDRDGVINVDYGHVYEIKKFHFVDGIFDLCKSAQQNGYKIFVVTNQAGIAKGYYTEEDFHILNDYMISKFDNHGIEISKVYFCPFHIEAVIAKYKKDSYDRKPNPGMLLKAKQDFHIDMSKSKLIGDKETDIVAADKAGIGMKILYGVSEDSISDLTVGDFDKKVIDLIFSDDV